ncbi:toxin RelE [Advenella kashmirensis W13003]|uniref:Toxin RelE n=1 Tax=Advenella kashmirensis W13003 TaxID=1424334 RepID=V8QU11_9BURK|nr:type II toxin-antitoxin system RelE/ParE family toxin [Advenella kashmirensis]ETF03107.1 toxin RelE [Advenella kashmirensis W13003]
MKKVRFSAAAEADLESIGDYIAQESPRRAVSFIAEIRMQCHKIATTPSAYRLRPEIAEESRSCPHGNYVIFFQPRDADILIVRILHGARDIQALFRKSAT